MDSKNLFTLSHPYGKVNMVVASEGGIELLKMQGIDIPDNVEPIKNIEDVIDNPYEFVDSTKYGVALYVMPFCEPVICYLPYDENNRERNVKYEVLRDAVDGYLEHVTTDSKTNFDVWVNEEGMLENMLVNNPLICNGEIYDCTKGNMLITGVDYNEGTTIGLSPEQIKEAWKMYKNPCVVSIDESRRFYISNYVNNKQNRAFLSNIFNDLVESQHALYSKRSIIQLEKDFGSARIGSLNFKTMNDEYDR